MGTKETICDGCDLHNFYKKKLKKVKSPFGAHAISSC